MKQVLILATNLQPDYWNTGKEARYKNQKYTELPQWNELELNCPIPGIGRYYGNYSESPFVYLKINGMRYDPTTGIPYFNINPIAKSDSSSTKLYDKLPTSCRKYFSAIDASNLLGILKDINEEPPKEWIELLDSQIKSFNWKDYIGRHFLEILENKLSNDDFEDRIAELLTALGFSVNQKGHKVKGEYPDGTASIHNYVIVYDCKNVSQDYYSTAGDIRAIKKYSEDEKKILSAEKIYPAFIARSFAVTSEKQVYQISVDFLLYLLYKKLSMGFKFSLSPIKKILDNFTPLKIETIDNEWRKN